MAEPKSLPAYYDCGICGSWHPRTWDGDCREDANRFASDELDAMHGAFGWEAVEMPTWDDDDDDPSGQIAYAMHPMIGG